MLGMVILCAAAALGSALVGIILALREIGLELRNLCRLLRESISKEN